MDDDLEQIADSTRGLRTRRTKPIVSKKPKQRTPWEPEGEVGKSRAKRYREKLRADALTAYGGKCECCEEKTSKFLTIDHINGDGASHKKELGLKNGAIIYRWLRNNKYPPGFRVLCWNCNCGRHMNNGVCPHKGSLGEPRLAVKGNKQVIAV